MAFPVTVHKSEHGYCVTCACLPGCVSQGETYEEAIENIKCAINEYMEAVGDAEKSKDPDATVVYVEVEG